MDKEPPPPPKKKKKKKKGAMHGLVASLNQSKS